MANSSRPIGEYMPQRLDHQWPVACSAPRHYLRHCWYHMIKSICKILSRAQHVGSWRGCFQFMGNQWYGDHGTHIPVIYIYIYTYIYIYVCVCVSVCVLVKKIYFCTIPYCL